MSKSAFIDEVEIFVGGGDGGDGIISFLRERARPNGGPNGGDGGRGGCVRMTANASINTLLHYRFQRRIIADNGRRGMGKDRAGAHGEDTHLSVPPGTRVIDADTNCLHADLINIGDSTVLAEGGRGGFGNARFKSSVKQAPRIATTGGKGDERRFRLELNVLADIGLLGMPNAGKSTLLRALSSARPKIADYPFTTLKPQLGVVSAGDHDVVVVADIPGLIAGAAQGAGLGNRFLRHLSRTAFLCHVVDAAADSLYDNCQVINEELRQADNRELSKKPSWLIMNKIDQLPPDERQQREKLMRERFPFFERIFLLSALTGEGVAAITQSILTRHAQSAH